MLLCNNKVLIVSVFIKCFLCVWPYSIFNSNLLWLQQQVKQLQCCCTNTSCLSITWKLTITSLKGTGLTGQILLQPYFHVFVLFMDTDKLENYGFFCVLRNYSTSLNNTPFNPLNYLKTETELFFLSHLKFMFCRFSLDSDVLFIGRNEYYAAFNLSWF